MPEIWLNYGTTDVVVDIRAENLGDELGDRRTAMSSEEVAEKLGVLDVSKPMEIVVLNATRAVKEAIVAIFAACESKSAPFPKILAERPLVEQTESMLPEGATVAEFESSGEIRSRLAFIGEVGLDGLFGYETVATRLLRRFGGARMHDAYSKRSGNSPCPGEETACMDEARSFASQFEITAIEVVGGGGGIGDIAIGNPSETALAASVLGKAPERMTAPHRSVMISAGNATSNATLSGALHSLWSCARGVSDGGLAVLFAECGNGLGSEALQKFVEGRMTVERTKRPPRYMEGMEDLLYLSEARDRIAIALVSTLPKFYTTKLGMTSLDSAKLALEYVLSKGPRQKIAIVPDGAHTLLGK